MLSDYIVFWMRHNEVPRLQPWEDVTANGVIIDFRTEFAKQLDKIGASFQAFGSVVRDRLLEIKGFQIALRNIQETLSDGTFPKGSQGR